jgi:hypothetical protein
MNFRFLISSTILINIPIFIFDLFINIFASVFKLRVIDLFLIMICEFYFKKLLLMCLVLIWD